MNFPKCAIAPFHVPQAIPAAATRSAANTTTPATPAEATPQSDVHPPSESDVHPPSRLDVRPPFAATLATPDHQCAMSFAMTATMTVATAPFMIPSTTPTRDLTHLSGTLPPTTHTQPDAATTEDVDRKASRLTAPF